MSSKSNSPSPVSAPSPKERGKRAFQAGHFAEAIEHWSTIAEPDEALKRALAEAHFRHAAALHLDTSSLPHLQSATLLMPNDPVYAYWEAVGLHKSGRFQEALGAYQQAESLGLAQAPGAAQRNSALSVWLAQQNTGQIGAWPELSSQSNDPRHATPRMVYDALTLLARNDEDSTKKAIARLSEMSPKPLARDVGAQRYAYLGVAHARRGNPALAVENWRLAARTLPTHTLVQRNLAASTLTKIHEALVRGDLDLAQKLAAEVSTEDTVLNAALSGLQYDAALSAAHKNNWAEAAQQLHRVAQSLTDAKPAERRPILHNLALLYEMAENWAAAAANWREVLRVLPRGKRAAENTPVDQRKWVRRRAIDCYKRADQLDEAVKVLRQTLKQTPEDVDVRLDLVRALYANDQEQAAENEAQRLLERDPNHLDTLLQLGEMQMESRKLYLAEKNLDHAINIAPDDRRVRAGLAEVLHQYAHFNERLHEYDQAIARFERAIQYTPDDLSLMICASNAYAAAKQMDKAHDLLARILKVGKGKFDTYYNIARFWIDQQSKTEIEAMIQQAERDSVLDARLLGMIGMEILDTVYPTPPKFVLDAIMRKYGAANVMRGSPLFNRPTEPTDTTMRDYGHTLLQRAIQHPSATPEMLMPALYPLLGICPHEVLPYCQWMAEHLPNDAMSIVILGCAQAIQKQYKAAEAAFDRARILAKAAKDAVAEEMARDFRRNLNDPAFPDVVREIFSAAAQGGRDVELDFGDLDF